MRLVMPALVLLLFAVRATSAFAFAQKSDFEKSTPELKAIVFLSASCPCSQSHVDHLNKLNDEYKNLEVFGVITDEIDPSNLSQLMTYYSDQRFQFPIIADREQDLVKEYNALKTPHVVLLRRDAKGRYQRIYEGGVTDRRHFASSEKKFLEANLVALKAGKSPPYRQGQSLGCYIRRF